MKKKRNRISRYGKVILVLMLAGLSLVGYLIFIRSKVHTKGEISLALAARQTALVLAEKDDIQAADQSRFSVEERDSWYVPYVSYLYEAGIWNPEEIKPDGTTLGNGMTVGELLKLMEKLLPEQKDTVSRSGTEMQTELNSEETLVSQEKEDMSNDPLDGVTEVQWQSFLDQLAAVYDTEGRLQEKELLVLGTSNQTEDAGAWEVCTDQGRFRFCGLTLSGLEDRLIRARVVGDELFSVEETVSETVTYQNVWLEKTENGELWVELYGISRKFPVTNAGEACQSSVADLTLEEGAIRTIFLKKERIRGTLQAVSDSALEIEGYGSVPLAESFHVYEIFDTVRELSPEELPVGSDQTEFVAAEGKICAALIGRSEAASEAIRVLLTDYKKGEIFHETAGFTCDRDFTIYYGEKSERHSAGETVEIGREDERFRFGAEAGTEAGAIRIEPDAGGKIGFTSFSRKYGQPWYEGSVELALQEEGILIINEVDLETYLCYVVPSEMPESYGLEALKAQAVCARSYARRQLEGSVYTGYHADVDDTTAFQVYNNTETDELTRQSVAETEGQVLTYEGNLITAYYYATSCGFGNDIQIWGGAEEQAPYLKSLYMEREAKEIPDLSREEVFRTFLDQSDEQNLEYHAPWYRWQTMVTADQLKTMVDQFLTGYAKEHRELISVGTDGTDPETETKTGSETEAKTGSEMETKMGSEMKAEALPETLGSIRQITVLERSGSGYVNRLRIEGDEGTMEILRPGTVRQLLGNTDLVYEKRDGSTADGRAILPSATIYLEEIREGETLAGYRIHGGGYGHGVGMSQTAASALAGSGYGYQEILGYFYPGCRVDNP